MDKPFRPLSSGASHEPAGPGLGRSQVDQLEQIRERDRAILEVGAVRYIKLGEKGKWVSRALSQGILPFGYRAVDHRYCTKGNWEEVRGQLVGMGRTNGGASQGLRELKDFYSLPDDTLWVTIADGHVWWTFADGPVIENDEADPEAPTRFRRTRKGWCKTSLNGVPFTVRSLSSALISTANYKMTICAIKQADYLLRKICDQIDPFRAAANALQTETTQLAVKMIRQLDWRDFETLVDLIFMRGGWQRISALGREQADVDLILKQPVTGETAWVQVKSRSTQPELDQYLDRFQRHGSCDRFFFVYHSAAKPLSAPADARIHLWSAERVASAAAEVGLMDWLVDHAAYAGDSGPAVRRTGAL
ncbi:restriction endonuclease [Bradyrhizobium sp.]|jgi:hypothetical protein|uniref:restriction endonuclease n=1 Tax=Bradyrhizobium sp. TaxID=376 RepID=UPI002E07B648|nr:restriction endonuclease [Bradyrhizobium sp.]